MDSVDRTALNNNSNVLRKWSPLPQLARANRALVSHCFVFSTFGLASLVVLSVLCGTVIAKVLSSPGDESGLTDLQDVGVCLGVGSVDLSVWGIQIIADAYWQNLWRPRPSTPFHLCFKIDLCSSEHKKVKHVTFPFSNIKTLPRPLFRILLSCVLTLSQLFPTMIKPRAIPSLIHSNGQLHLVVCPSRHMPITP